MDVEKGEIRDDVSHRSMRLQLVHLRDQKLLAFVKSASAMDNMEAIVTLLSTTNLQKVDDADLAELCFAMGPVLLTNIVRILLSRTRSDGDLEGVQAVSAVRHTVLLATHSSPTR